MDGKRLLSVAMAAVLLCTGLPQSTVYAEQGAAEQSITNEGNGSEQKSGQTEDGYQYKELEDGTLEITKYVGTATELEIPSEIEGKQVTSIGDGYVFYGCNNLNSVSIPEGVVSIGDYSFYGCYNLTSVMLPEGVASIGNGSFVGCSKLTSVKIPESVMSIGGDAFGGTALTSVVIPERVTSIREGVFGNCSSLTSVEIPEGVTSIGNNAFISCSNLTSVVIPEKVTSIGDLAFYCCNNLSNVNIPEGVTSIGDSAFGGTALTSVEIPEGVIRIRDRAFGGCSSLTSVSIPEGVTYIGDGAFGGTALTSVELPKGVTGIGELAFSECYNLTSVKIPEGVISIGDKAFYNCYNLTSVELPKGVTYIGDSAFYSCTGLKNVSIPEGMKNIGDNAFRNCIGLTSVIIPEGVTSIGNFAFWNCSRLTDVTIQKGVESIGDYVFQNCNKLTSVSISEGVKSIGEYAFGYCDQLTSINLPKGITSIGAGAFRGCEKLEQVVLPENLTCIEVATFGECIGLKSVVIPKKVTEIWEGAFSGCSNLESIEVAEDNPKYDSRNNCNAIIETDSDTLIVGCKNTEIPSGVIRIGDGAFFGCSGLTSVEIPNSITSIGNKAFYYCNGLISITIPKEVTSIDDAFTVDMYNKNFALYVYHGSYAERYAKDSNINYCYIGEYQHNYKPEISKEPTCTEPGETTYTCIECGNSYKEPITAKGHTLKEVVKKATEKENGSITMQCTECQAIEGEPTIIYAVEKIELSETSFVRDGSVKMPSITIEDSQGNALQKMIDYTINYPYAIEPGTYTVDIRFSENYTGTVERTFTIMPDLTGDPQEDFTYRELEDGSLEITKYAGKETELVIPEKIDDKIVSKIAAHAFSDCKNLVSVIIPESVTSIEQRAFASCSLKSVTLPQGIKSLEKELFNYSGLTSITIPEGVTIIGEGAFGGCTNLTSVTIPKGVITIGEGAFGGCINLRNVEIPKGVKNIEDGAFSNCKLTSVTIPEGVVSIGIMAFMANFDLKEVVIPKSVTSIGRYVFQGCNNIVLCVYHDSYAERYAQEKNINYRYIEDCEHNYKAVVKKATEKENGSITKQCTECQVVEGEPTVIYAAEKIELSETSYICDGSVKKPSVTIKDSQDNILQERRDYTISYPDDAKEEGTYTITITFSGNYSGTAERTFTILPEDKDGSEGDYTYHKLEDESLEITKYDGNDTELVIPEKLNGMIVTKIGECAFSNCTNLTSVIIPQSVVNIGTSAFSGCSNLTSVAIPESVISIETDAFIDCSKELTLQVVPGSYGESYAKENNIKYRDPAACEHNYITQTTEPTCTAAGEKVFVCTKCGDIEKREIIPILGHKEVKDPGTEATCTEEGKTEGSHCEICGEVLKEQEVIPALGHKEVKDPGTEATCTEEGKTEGSHCEVCGEVLKEQEVILALGHKEVKDPRKEATCTEEGKTEGSHCEVCGEVLKEQEVIPALGHTYQKEIIKATTKKNGSIIEKCTNCGEKQNQIIIYAVKTVKLSKTSYVYNGKTQKPSITVKDSKGKVLNSQEDYTVTYPKTVKNVGIYTVKIKFKGNYSGTVTKTYTITPKGTSISKITSKKKSFVVTWKKQAKQITGYEVAYAPNAKFAKKNTTILNVAKSKTAAKPKKALKAKKKYYVRIRTYKTIKQDGKTQKIYSGWSKTKSVITKK